MKSGKKASVAAEGADDSHPNPIAGQQSTG